MSTAGLDLFFILHVLLTNQIIFPQNVHHSYFIPFLLPTILFTLTLCAQNTSINLLGFGELEFFWV